MGMRKVLAVTRVHSQSVKQWLKSSLVTKDGIEYSSVEILFRIYSFLLHFFIASMSVFNPVSRDVEEVSHVHFIKIFIQIP